jgi:hypothetical protein
MYRKCRHIKPNGLRCDSPALKQAYFCYFHTKIHTVGAEPNLKYGPMLLPAPEGSAAIMLSIAKINDGLLSGRINTKQAGLLLYSLQIASQNLKSHDPSDVDQTIETMTIAPNGDELAPEEIVPDEEDDRAEDDDEEDEDAEDGDDDDDEGGSDDEVDDDEEADEGNEEDGSDAGDGGQATNNDAVLNPGPHVDRKNDALQNPHPEEDEHPDAIFFKGLIL